MSRVSLLVILICLTASGAAARAENRSQNTALEPGKSQLPAWLEQGKIRFARFDGGPIEVQKSKRSSEMMGFAPQETEVLANLYGKYSDRLVELLTQAHVNFVWVTYSVGFSWQDEASQRAEVRELVRKLHHHGIHVAAYMCAVSIFWQSMFRDVPQSVRWIMFNPQGLPYRYSGGHDPLRFIADLRNPAWIEYQQKRVGGIADDGLDAIFFDNTALPEYASDQTVAAFFTQIRRYLHDKKRSTIPLFSNFGLSPSRIALNRDVNFTFDESWREPGVWGVKWNVSNIRRERWLDGVLPSWKPVITEYSMFHHGDRNTGFLSAHAEKLSIAEATSFGTAYTWDMEGPFDAGLIDRDPKAMKSWAAITQYNGFLENHPSLYVGAVNVTPVAILIPDNYNINFAWSDTPSSAFFDFLSRHSVLYSVKPASQITDRELELFSGVVLPFYAGLTSKERQLVRRYQTHGGKVYAFAKTSELDGLKCETSSPDLVDHLIANSKGEQEVLAKLASLAHGATRIRISGAPHVLANVTTIEGEKRIVIHFLNYNVTPASGLKFKLSLGRRFKGLAGKQVTLASPDSRSSSAPAGLNWKGTTLQGTLPALHTYTVVSIQ
ncbi:MAG: hypothetical protein ACRD2B_00660 [Terriglobia bacterium]